MATVNASATIVSTYTVSGACSGQGGFTTAYRVVAARVPTATNGLALRLAKIPGADYVVSPTATIQCPGFAFALKGTGADKTLTTGTIGQTLTLTSVDLMASATRCEAKASPAANPVIVSCHSSGALVLVFRTYAITPKPEATGSVTTSG